MKTWSPSSWRDFPIKQQPTYPDRAALQRVEEEPVSYTHLTLPTTPYV